MNNDQQSPMLLDLYFLNMAAVTQLTAGSGPSNILQMSSVLTSHYNTSPWSARSISVDEFSIILLAVMKSGI